jgi:hypothetical protein
MARVKAGDNIDLFQIFLRRHVPALNSPGDQGDFWSRGGSKILEQVTYPVSELSTGLTRVMKQVLPGISDTGKRGTIQGKIYN